MKVGEIVSLQFCSPYCCQISDLGTLENSEKSLSLGSLFRTNNLRGCDQHEVYLDDTLLNQPDIIPIPKIRLAHGNYDVCKSTGYRTCKATTVGWHGESITFKLQDFFSLQCSLPHVIKIQQIELTSCKWLENAPNTDIPVHPYPHPPRQ